VTLLDYVSVLFYLDEAEPDVILSDEFVFFAEKGRGRNAQ